VTRQPWPVSSLLLLCSAVFLSVTTELVPTGLLPGMSRDLGVSPAQLGLLVTGYALMVALFAAPLGSATMRLPRRGLLVTALAIYTASNAIMIVAPNYPVAAGARLLGGLTHGLFWAVLGGYAARLVSPERVGRAITVVSSGGAGAVLLGVPAGTALGTTIGWRATFAVLTGLSALVAVLALKLLPQVPGSSAAVRTPLREVLRLPGFPPIVAMTAVTMLGAYTFITYIALLLQHSGLTELQVAPALLASGIAGALMLPLAAWLVDRHLHLGIIAGAATLTVALGLLAVTGFSPVLAVIAVTLSGMAMGLLPIFMQTATLRVAPEHTEQASGVNASAFNIGIAGGALAGALTLDTRGVGAVPLTAALIAASGLLVYLVGTRQSAVRSRSGRVRR
jgi:DHA1 family inner membrane transport protein